MVDSAKVELAINWNGQSQNSVAETKIKNQIRPHLGNGIPTLGVTKITIHIINWNNKDQSYIAKLSYDNSAATDTLAGKL